MSIGGHVKSLRTKKEMKGETLGKAIVVTRASISQIENGTTDIKISTLHQIAQVLDTDLCSLIYGETVRSGQDYKDLTTPQETVLIEMAVIDRLFAKIESLDAQIVELKKLERLL